MGYKIECVSQQLCLNILVQLRKSLLNISIGEDLVIVHIQGWVGIDFHQPYKPVVINEDVKAKNLETTRICMICTYKTMISIFQIWLQGNDCLGC